MEKLNTFSKEQIQLVNDVDSWAQEHNEWLDRKFSQLYTGSNGWKYVAEISPHNFLEALQLAKEYEHKL